MKWWLISDGDVETIRKGLVYRPGVKERNTARHALDTGLHKTQKMPGDFQEVATAPGPEILVRVKPTDGMYLRQIIASGETEKGEKFEVFSVIPDGSLIVTIEKKEQYILLMKSVVDAVLRHSEEMAEGKKNG